MKKNQILAIIGGLIALLLTIGIVCVLHSALEINVLLSIIIALLFVGVLAAIVGIVLKRFFDFDNIISEHSKEILGALGCAIMLFYAIAAIVLLVKVCRIDVLNNKLLAVLVVGILVVFFATLVGQFFKISNIAADVIVIVAMTVFVVANGMISTSENAVEKMNNNDTKDIVIEVIVLKDSVYDDLIDLKDAKFGAYTDKTFDQYYTKTLQDINAEFGHQVESNIYTDYIAMATGLLKNEVDAVLLTSAYTATVDDIFQSMSEEDENFLGKNDSGEPIPFSDVTRTVARFTITVPKEEHEKNESHAGIPQTPTDHETMDTSQIPFVVYVSGIDITGNISTISRSDVNVLVAINPVTKQIAMVTTPRDSYVHIPGVTDNSSYRDKLTHAGLYGSGCSASIATLEEIYGVDINYYVRVNFTSVVDIVDLLGGVSVYSGQDFTERWDGFHFHKGYNDVNGTQALHFARERYTIAGGDYARGRNHTELIKAVFNKAMSPSILSNYTGILETLSNNIETNFSLEEIAVLVKMELSNKGNWNFVSYCTEGINGGQQEYRYCHSYAGAKLCVTILDENSVAGGSELIEKVLNGEIVEQEDSFTEGTFGW